MRRVIAVTSVLLCAVMLGAGLAAGQTAAKIGFDPSKVTITVKDAKLSDMLKSLADQSRNALLALPENFPDKPVTLDLKDVGYFEALDAICAAAKLSYEPAKDALALCAPPKPRDAGDYCGPGTVKAIQVAKLNSFRDASYPDSRSIWMVLGEFWEDRLPVVADACEVTKVSTDDGRSLNLRARRMGQFMMGPYNSGGTVRTSARQVLSRLQNVPDKGESKTLQLQGTFRLSLGSGEKTLAVANVLAEGDLSAEEGGITFKVTKVQKMGGGIVNLGGPRTPGKQQIMFTIDITRSGGMVAMGNGSPYGIVLVDPDGKRYPALTTSGMQQAKGDTWTASLWTSFEKPDKLDDTWSLVYVYPEKQESKEWAFDIKDVPLP